MLAAMLVLSNAAQIGAAVVCKGSDGHRDVESSVCSCCAVTALHDETLHDGSVPAGPSCSDCVDVPLRMPPLNPKASRLSPPDIVGESRVLALSCGMGCRDLLAVPAGVMDQHWQSLSHLSTVVLLT